VPDIDIEIVVEDNTDRLSGAVVHQMFVDMVERVTKTAEEALRVNAAMSVTNTYPRDTKGEMVAHVSSEGPIDEGLVVSSEIGIPPIEEARLRYDYDDLFEGGADPAHYPKFKDQGTRDEIFSPRGRTMKFRGDRDEIVFRDVVPGQKGAHFMAATYEEIVQAMPAQIKIFGEEVEHL